MTYRSTDTKWHTYQQTRQTTDRSTDTNNHHTDQQTRKPTYRSTDMKTHTQINKRENPHIDQQT